MSEEMNSKQRTHFPFFLSFFESIDSLEPADQLPIYKAIAEYSFFQKEPDLVGVSRAIWKLLRPVLDSSRQKFENGGKGGAPKGSRNNPKGRKSNQELTENKPTTNQELSNKDKEEDKEEENEEDSNRTSYEVPQEVKPLLDFSTHSINVFNIVDRFNEITNGKFGKIRAKMSVDRKKFVEARISEYGEESFIEVIEKATKSKFLAGQNNRGWIMSFDWMIKADNFEKILTGNYDDRANEDNALNTPNNVVASTIEGNYETLL